MKKTLIVLVAATLLYCGVPAAQELPPDMLADQYLLAATAALQNQDRQAAINAFQRIEALDVTPPTEFFYFYGKVLVEDGIATDNVPSMEKGQALLKKYVVASGREAEHYQGALEVLNTAGDYQDLVALVEAQMVRVEGGTFTMGCMEEEPDCEYGESPAHRVRVSSFEISKYEVTQELWVTVMGDNPSRGYRNFKECPQCPVHSVSWHDVQAFLRKLNRGGGRYRLPSEAEWEYAARGGQRSRGYRYAGSNNLDAVAWYWENSGDKFHPVGQKQANELGLYDMLGNVQEWVQDCHQEEDGPGYHGAPSDGRAWEEPGCARAGDDERSIIRRQRGGYWRGSRRELRLTYRESSGSNGPYYLYYVDGFRIARSLD